MGSTCGKPIMRKNITPEDFVTNPDHVYKPNHSEDQVQLFINASNKGSVKPALKQKSPSSIRSVSYIVEE